MMLSKLKLMIITLVFLTISGTSQANTNRSLESLVNSSKVNHSRGTSFNGTLKDKYHTKTGTAKTEKLFETSEEFRLNIEDPVEREERTEEPRRGGISKCTWYRDHPEEWANNNGGWTIDELCTHECDILSEESEYNRQRGRCQEGWDNHRNGGSQYRCMNYDEFRSMCQDGGWWPGQ